MTEIVAGWREHLPHAVPLPHPSWRNNAWLKANAWFGTDLLPVLRQEVRRMLAASG
jgi:uracil-DNA glycosylase